MNNEPVGEESRKPADISGLSTLDENKLAVTFPKDGQGLDALNVKGWVRNDSKNHPRLMQAHPVRDAFLIAQVTEVSKKMGIYPPPKVLICENGSFNGMAVESLGAIVISEEANCMKAENLQGLLAHEIMHMHQDPAQVKKLEQLEKQYLQAHNNLRQRSRLGEQIDQILSGFEKQADKEAANAVGKNEYVSSLARLALLSAAAKYNHDHPDHPVALCDIMQDKVPEETMQVINRMAIQLMRESEETHGSYNQRIRDVQALPAKPVKSPER